MENIIYFKIKRPTPFTISKFLDYNYNSGFEFGDGSGSGGKAGSGYGFIRSMINLDSISDFSFSFGTGFGSDAGYGYGHGYGCGYDSCEQNDYNFGNCFCINFYGGIKSFCGSSVYIIDQIHGDVVKGRILNNDLTTTPCYVVKHKGHFGHGDTLKKAAEAAFEKGLKSISIEERIAAFIEAHEKDKTYPNTDFFEWHNKLTGSCQMGRETFARNHGIDMNGSMTVIEFIELTENAYAEKLLDN